MSIILPFLFFASIFYMERKNIQGLVSFFQTHFANLQFTSNDNLQFLAVRVAACPLRFLTLKHYISERIGWSVLIFQKAEKKVATDHAPNFQRPKSFCPEVASEKIL